MIVHLLLFSTSLNYGSRGSRGDSWLKLAMEKGYQKVWIEADCKYIIEELNGKKKRSSWKVDPFVNSIKEIRKNLDLLSVS